MAILNEYHRPDAIREALQLLNRRDLRLKPLAGGSWLIGQLETRALPDVDGVVDLRDLGFDAITTTQDHIRIGAMTTLAAIGAHSQLRDLAQGLLAKAAQSEGPPNLRNVATIGGSVATALYDSEFYAALLAMEATVLFHHAAQHSEREPLLQRVPLALYAPAPQPQGDLITGIQIASRPLHSGYARVARTPSDRPIVAALAVAAMDQPQSAPRVALCGVATRPILAGAPLTPPDDFKGSASYRRALAEIVTARALAQIEEHVRAT